MSTIAGASSAVCSVLVTEEIRATCSSKLNRSISEAPGAAAVPVAGASTEGALTGDAGGTGDAEGTGAAGAAGAGSGSTSGSAAAGTATPGGGGGLAVAPLVIPTTPARSERKSSRAGLYGLRYFIDPTGSRQKPGSPLASYTRRTRRGKAFQEAYFARRGATQIGVL